MTIQEARMDVPLLSAAEETELAKTIEAGVYAGHLLTVRAPRDSEALRAVLERGRWAWQRLWSANLRLVMLHANDFARRHGLPLDDLFQEGCIGLANAMQRYDYRRGLRFTTLAHEYVHHAVAASAARRCGMLDGPLHRQRIRQLLRRHEVTPPGGLRRLAESLGISLDSALAAVASTTSLDELPAAQAVVVTEYDRIEGVGTDFLNLLGDEAAEFLRLRFGIDRPEHSLRELAALLRISESTARRLENSALELARTVLTQDDERCLLPPQREPDATMKAIGTRLRALAPRLGRPA